MRTRVVTLAVGIAALVPGAAFAQDAPPAQPGYGQAPPPQGAPPPTNYGQPPPNQGYGQPPPNQGYGQPPPNQGYGQPPPNQGYGQPPPNQGYQQQYSDPPRSDRPRRQEEVEEPPLPPPREEESKGKIPPFSIRVDPLNLILDGSLNLELEVGLLSFMTVELVPTFVANSTPPTLSYFGSFDSSLRRESNGPGALAGASIGLGFWLNGTVLRGNVLRVIFQNTGYEFKSEGTNSDGTTTFKDSTVHTDRVLMGMFGSHSKWGAFTLASGIGFGIDLNKEERCFKPSTTGLAPTTGCGDIEVKGPDNSRLVVSDWLYPAVIAARLSLGVAFD